MNSHNSQFNSQTIKIIVLLTINIFFYLTATFAQGIENTNFIENLYESNKVYYTSGNYHRAINNINKILLLKNKSLNDIKPEYFKVLYITNNRLNYYEKWKLKKSY